MNRESVVEEPIVFSNLPLRENLCHLLVSIDPKEVKDASVKSDFQWQLLKTRLLLFSDKNIIASPGAGTLRYINIVAKKEYYRSGHVAKLLSRHRLKLESVCGLSFPVFEQCLMYNLIVKLAPAWNKVEKYFIEGKYFLMKRGALNAIELNIVISGDLLILYASPVKLWLRNVSLLDLLPSSKIEETLSKPFFIDLFAERQWVHVLPSFKRGHLVYVTNRIPKESTFVDYLQMRRHWKNTYGYRLPEDDSSMIYVGITFFNNNDYLYPLECVRRGMHMNRDDYSSVIKFAKSVSVKAAAVCGNDLILNNLTALQNKSKVKVNKTTEWSVSTLAELGSDLVNKWLGLNDNSESLIESQDISLYTENMDTPSTNVAGEEEVVDSIEAVESTSSEGISSNSPIENDTGHEKWLQACSNFITEISNSGKKRSYLKACRPRFNKNDLLKSVFKPKSNKRAEFGSTNPFIGECSTSAEIRDGIQNTPYKPSFNKKLVPEDAKDNLLSCSVQDLFARDTVKKCDVDISENDGNSVPLFNRSKSPLPVPHKPFFKRKSPLYNHVGATKIFKITETVCDEKLLEDMRSNEDPLIKFKNSLSPPAFNIDKKTVVETKADVGLNMQELKCLMSGDMKKNKSKRKSDDGSNTSKERKKPTVLTVSEVENLVSTNQLEKANVPSLCCYLKGKGIPFSSKARKEVLIEKIKQIDMGTNKQETFIPFEKL